MSYTSDIAITFFKTRYVEVWGMRNSKICEELGTPISKYTIHPQDIMIKFSALNIHDTSKLINDVLHDALDDVLENEL